MNEKSDNAAPSGEPAEVRDAQVRSEIQEYLHVSQQRRRLFPRAALVGLLAGLVAVAFRAVLAAADSLRNALIAWAHPLPHLWLVGSRLLLRGWGVPVRIPCQALRS